MCAATTADAEKRAVGTHRTVSATDSAVNPKQELRLAIMLIKIDRAARFLTVRIANTLRFLLQKRE